MISIIIPIYNRAHLITETLLSIKAQTYTNWECIIVDDGSTDNTIEITKDLIKDDSRFKLFKRPETSIKGANACRNYGFEQSKGTYIQFFDSDDIMLPNCLNGRITVLEKNNFDFVVFGISNMVLDKIVANKVLYIINSQEEALEKFIESKIIPWNLQRTLYRKSFLLKKDRLFNTNLQRFQDIEFNVRLLVNSKVLFKMVPEVDCYYRTAGVANPRQDSFYNDVFLSIPEYYKSITTNIPKEVLNKNKVNLQKWLYHITALYTRNKVDKTLFVKAIKSGKKYIGLTLKQVLILHILFIIKREPKSIIGKVRLLKFLKAIY